MSDKDLKVLTSDEIIRKLKSLHGWIYNEDKISKQFEFKSFNNAIRFVVKLTSFFNKIDHHPDIHIYYKKIKFDLQSFSVGGKVTDRDFKVAKKIEVEFRKLSHKTKTSRSSLN